MINCLSPGCRGYFLLFGGRNESVQRGFCVKCHVVYEVRFEAVGKLPKILKGQMPPPTAAGMDEYFVNPAS